jgi:glyoxylase-like metal-dependent hydrolase (beta-lactamase superfamily II)
MTIEKIYPSGFGANSYVLTKDGKSAIVIDPSSPKVMQKLIEWDLKAEYVLLTHCHFDHVMGIAPLVEQGAKVVMSEAEAKLVGTNADLFEMIGAPRPNYTADIRLKHGEELELCGISIRAFITPGHTQGSTCYQVTDGEKVHLFTGDTLFENSIGRTDFPTGDLSRMRDSLLFLSTLPDMPVYAGHGEDTTMERERKSNMFLKDL